MDELSTVQRVKRLAAYFDESRNSPEHRFKLDRPGQDAIQSLAAAGQVPQDVLLVLAEIGEMRDWGHRGCAMVDWWIPIPIEQTNRLGRCIYVFDEGAVEKGNDLLAFAWDCDAKVYFLDTATSPWRVVYADGLSADMAMQEPRAPGFSPIPIWPLEQPDFLSVIEEWAAFAR